MTKVALITFVFLPYCLGQLRLRPQDQKTVTRFALTDAAVPNSLKSSTLRRVTTRDGAVWRAEERGLARQHQGRIEYLQGLRYLPDDKVESIETLESKSGGGPSGIWVRTSTGVSRIEVLPMTLATKAAHFERRIAERHDRLGFVSSSHLERPGDLSSNWLNPSDNDGLWTAMYGAAECFRFAATKSPEALARARRAIEAVLKLEEVTGRPGYPARSYIRKGDWRGQGGVWHWTLDGEIEWKADTSSDEIVGHFYLFAIAYDLLPDPALRNRIRTTAVRIVDHILDHGLNLTDVHGQPTYWGRWSKDYFATPRGRGDGPLNALELLSFLLVTHHLTGEARYLAAYDRLIDREGYLSIATQLKELREEINYSDEELAMLPFYTVFRYEKNAGRLALYRQALDAWWQNIQREKNPLWMFIYQTAWPNRRLDLADAAFTLYRIPMDLISWRVDNSWRTDIKWSGELDRFGKRQALTWIPPDERPIMKWNSNPFVVNGGDDGTSEDDGAFFLLPYWMGRYHGFLIGE